MLTMTTIGIIRLSTINVVEKKLPEARLTSGGVDSGGRRVCCCCCFGGGAPIREKIKIKINKYLISTECLWIPMFLFINYF